MPLLADMLGNVDVSDSVNVLLNAVTVAVLVVLLKWVHSGNGRGG
jgi:hypothetical protein